MSTFVVGGRYQLGGAHVTCIDRFFGGAHGECELVKLAWDQPGPIMVRTARTVGDLVRPRVTETLGGCLRSPCCDHLDTNGKHRSFTANAGPHIGHECCSLCGGRVDGGNPQPYRESAAWHAGYLAHAIAHHDNEQAAGQALSDVGTTERA